MPALHVEVLEGMEVKLGSFVSYQRQRRRKILLACERARVGDSVAALAKADKNHLRFRDREQALESVNGWAWGPLRPGPASKAARNLEINKLYGEGTPVKALSDQFDLSRQRVHQIVGPKQKVFA